ncbi:maleylpyruvate isomerase family mycothiol-dependent enzyme [Rhodococcus sp. I2R]|uniref:maleylpyruvate isomerase family mycothiol-dependent enzyme n=1 Tax=Rhodococcus sp. I2R TaxID=2855445 RepID=UPI001E4749C2|nr:maleylpyruvate isomerase family mycothiol-dependent enzyme [Rhodococcus sp. I2R]MCC8928836.1 maleylpyruvate isomerase family mycothiol-dependent enzyme [Rhodococcus sp. I2R]
MDVSTLHAATETLAEFLSEVTQGDLRQSTPVPAWDVGDLYLHLIGRNSDIAAAVAQESVVLDPLRADAIARSDLDASANLYGGGFEERYRQAARRMEYAFASVSDAELRINMDDVDVTVGAVYENQVNETVLHTWDLASAMGFSYQPASDVARRIVESMLQSPLGDVDAIWHCALRMSGRMPVAEGGRMSQLVI